MQIRTFRISCSDSYWGPRASFSSITAAPHQPTTTQHNTFCRTILLSTTGPEPSPGPLLSKAALHSTHLKSNWKQARFSIQETIVISSNPVSRHILGSVIDDKDVLIFFLFRFRVPDCGAGGCWQSSNWYSYNERPQSFYNHKAPTWIWVADAGCNYYHH